MAVSFNIPKSPAKQVYVSEKFLGADFTSEASTVDDTKSPNVENMIRSVPGKIRKRMGYEKLFNYGAPIYGVHHLSTTDIWLVHAGNKLYNLFAPKGGKWIDHSSNYVVNEDADNIVLLNGSVDDTVIYTGMAQHRSVSFQLNQMLVILDGTKARVYDGNTVRTIEEVAYIPTLTISKDYTGGGEDYEPLNLLQPAFIEQFYVKADQASVTTFQLTFGGLDSTRVRAWLLNSNGVWVEKIEGTHFSVNRSTGVVTFTSAPGASPITGEDNVKIQAYRTVPGYANRINHCTIGAMFGVNGANDRLFVSGNPDQGVNSDGELFTFINCDWFSQQYDPTYFADTWYSKLGSDTSAIMGYSIINNYLAAHKDYNEMSQSILIREGDLVDDQPVFKLINTLQGAGAISKYCFSYLATEPVFLTRLGVFAVTAQDITGEKYAQDRSYYLEGKLLKEANLENAFAYTWKDYYILGINDHLYILDGLQPMHSDRSRPYATRQYAGFYFTNVPASCFFEINGELYFGSSTGFVYKWYTDDKLLASYNDDGEPIKATWETADISEKLFYKKKTYRYLAVRCMPEISSSIDVYAQKNGIWQLIKEDTTTLKYFSYMYFIYSKMTYSTNKTQRVTATKIRLKKLDHVRFRFENDKLNEPLGINDFAVEYTQGGNVK
ncbi:hypothetical protein [Sharpea azabuensis]|uniref:hypothetical protein n=1 Tax=Sharpea azabuensis TaxID=322505 RepID=UPI001568C513|nr:hypothetical protein [Sharpea azabuensis]